MVKDFANIKRSSKRVRKQDVATRASSLYLEDCCKMDQLIRMNKKIIRYGVLFEGILKTVSGCCFLGVQKR